MAKLSKQEFYTGDSGKTVEVKDMASSHLMNAILHHERQLELLAKMRLQPWPTANDVINLQAREDKLIEVVNRLKKELASREVTDDEKENSPEPYSRLGGRL